MDNSIVFDKESAMSAFKCLMNMQDLEKDPKFGNLKAVYPLNTRYTVKKNNEIDSTFYTDKATSILAYALYRYDQDMNDFDETLFDRLISYTFDEHDLINDSQGEYSNFKGDMSFFDSKFWVHEQLYAYYSEFEILSSEENQEIFKRIESNEEIDDRVAIKKTENINGVEMDFYYLGSTFDDLTYQILEHDTNIVFLKERIPGNVLNAINLERDCNDIISIAYDCLPESEQKDSWAAYAEYTYGSVVMKNGYFEDVICHELGHHFDKINEVDLGPFYFTVDYNNGDFGKWDVLAKKYADEIETIRVGADISCGYYAEDMIDMHYEFYAEAFQLYFHSPETRAALPEKVRNTIEGEINKYANN